MSTQEIEPTFTEREMAIEVHLVKIDSSISELRASVDRLQEQLAEMGRKHDKERQQLNAEITSLKLARTQIMTMLAAAGTVGAIVVEILRKWMGI